jgi:glucokinase
VSQAYAIGVDIGGSSVKAVRVTPVGELLAETRCSFDPDLAMDFTEATRNSVHALGEAESLPPLALGLCTPGLPAPGNRSVAHLPQRLPGIEGFDWSTFLGGDRVVPVLNDGHAALMGEAWCGAARGRRNVLMITLGTGVGGAAMVDGRVLRGHSERAGHVGHISLDPDGRPDICRTPGSLEEAVGNCTVAERSGGRFTSTHALIQAHRDGDAGASAVWWKSVHALATGLVSLANVLDPEIVVIGGGIAAAGEALFTPLRERVQDMEWKIPGFSLQIVPAVLGEKAGAYGAAYHALQLQPRTSHDEPLPRPDLP